jgi:SAM-dependent methyltransferase
VWYAQLIEKIPFLSKLLLSWRRREDLASRTETFGDFFRARGPKNLFGIALAKAAVQSRVKGRLMKRNPRQLWNLKVYLIIAGTIMAILLMAYMTLGHLFVEAVYGGKAIQPLHELMKAKGHALNFYVMAADRLFYMSWFSMLFLLIMPIAIHSGLVTTWNPRVMHLEGHSEDIDSLQETQIGWWILVAAGSTLFWELLIIRLHSSYFQLFAYFKNISLLSCFLGLGIGYARGSARPLTTPLALPLLAIQVFCLFIMRFTPLSYSLQNPVLEQLGFGASTTLAGLSSIPFIISIFVLNALCFIPLGQLTSALMMRYSKLVSYSWNLGGSLAGIFLFSLVSFFWTPPSIWIILGSAAVMAFLYRRSVTLLPSLSAVLVLIITLNLPLQLNNVEIYSPYQILNLFYSKNEPPSIQTSNTYYQRMLDLRNDKIKNDDQLKKYSMYYSLPFEFNKKVDRVLIVGSGTGNDVAAAVRNGAKKIDAVEIDPAILKIGKELHPESPYDAPNVNAVVDDARAFMRDADKRYDLIIYGLLDSHTLLASKSGGIRLDSYVYTVEGFREARALLQEGGLISLTFSLIRPELGRKLFLMLREAFDGGEVIVYQVGYDGGYTFLAGNKLNRSNITTPTGFLEVTTRFSDESIQADISTDDWPFFYMPVRKYPLSYLMLMLILLIISGVFTRKMVAGAGSGFSFPFFFLGAGFMLIETKGITELALVYGSTWMVISAVIAAILIMAFLANLLVMRMVNPSPVITYSLLLLSLLAGLMLTYYHPVGLPPWLSRIFMTGVLTLPLFFSGFAFSSELNRSASVAVALSSNLLGAMLGGFLEYNSMYFGFRSLYILAMITYALAFAWSLRERKL